MAAELVAELADVQAALAADGGTVLELPPRTGETAEEAQRRVYLEQIEAVQQEVAAIEEAIQTERTRQQQRAADGGSDRVDAVLAKASDTAYAKGTAAAAAAAAATGGDGNGDDTHPALTAAAVPYDDVINLTAMVSGISVDSVHQTFSAGSTGAGNNNDANGGGDDDGDSVVRSFVVRGASSTVPFRVAFDVHERTLRLSNLAISLPPVMRAELSEFLARVERTGAVREFFAVFTAYSDALCRRHDTFEALKAEFGALVHVPYGAAGSLLRSAPPRAGVELQLLWRILVSPIGAVDTRIELFPRADRRAYDAQRVLYTVPDQFRNLVLLKGVRTATALVIRALSE